MAKASTIELKTIDFKLVGKSPLLLHNVQLANPLNKFARELKAISGNKQLTVDEKAEQLARIEFTGSLYWDDELGPYLPGYNILRCFMEGGTFSKKGTAIGQAVVDYTPKAQILYGAHYDSPEALRSAGFEHQAMVTIQRNKVLRTRPQFLNWACKFELTFDSSILGERELIEAAEKGGLFKGVGDGRKGGYGMGRFDIEII